MPIAKGAILTTSEQSVVCPRLGRPAKGLCQRHSGESVIAESADQDNHSGGYASNNSTNDISKAFDLGSQALIHHLLSTKAKLVKSSAQRRKTGRVLRPAYWFRVQPWRPKPVRLVWSSSHGLYEQRIWLKTDWTPALWWVKQRVCWRGDATITESGRAVSHVRACRILEPEESTQRRPTTYVYPGLRKD